MAGGFYLDIPMLLLYIPRIVDSMINVFRAYNVNLNR